MKKILFTGGGSAGHVTVNLALIPRFLKEGWAVSYIGSHDGIEKQLIGELPDVRYFGISTGKLRRYMDWQNVKDPFKVIGGVMQAYQIIRKQKPDVVFSKGGFVSVPVVFGAWLNRVPVLIHESDITPGLANRIAIPFSAAVCTTFPETEKHLRSGKTRYVGAVVRDDLGAGSAERGRAFCQFTRSKPVLLIMGGSLGARKINQTVRAALNRLTAEFQIVHLCGKGQLEPSLDLPGYRQYTFIGDELPDILAMTDVVISRAGSNSIFEFLALRKPMLLIPLTKEQSRGDQILNARSFETSGYCQVLEEENLTADTLASNVSQLYRNRESYVRRMAQSKQQDALSDVIHHIKQALKS
ncbi:undecaprenyldiphospho-muramoylpentapeptide beta-N-acetylglucosaminyltransferase [Paenibacillus mendelii]|uniref:UDP-N-acetylglucosamine--N-acetylmuramyl-(pentapeptide) pyrophosphoryl-undecaprenol N-acetylglucosamine transferase n=1 Tax=Paenibacillus mendelii TaxID=206163 RepID=A0ABV6JE77_9BACL|nr:undecaprenyldiphospho-muramoylpentapeptide beta-N-acetylglucosaminyltransferase [Paenibacillus mendelii]MCQ6562385.1 undecaprenyldiphospho-muramoylpentapeptide beta-N-acetylglucosaminyltransferase [Paenibacillus mendelii]